MLIFNRFTTDDLQEAFDLFYCQQGMFDYNIYLIIYIFIPLAWKAHQWSVYQFVCLPVCT